jgi:hypothetical protein
MMILSRQELIAFALRQNGDPIVEINVDAAQLEDAVDLALQMAGLTEELSPWDNLKLKLTTAALVRKQWAVNLMKYKGHCIGGMELNATALYDSAILELSLAVTIPAKSGTD